MTQTYVVWSPDGRPLHTCQLYSTARRLSAGLGTGGGNALVTAIPMALGPGPEPRSNEVPYGPIQLVEPTPMDQADEDFRLSAEQRQQAKSEAMEAAKAAGLTDAQIAALRSL